MEIAYKNREENALHYQELKSYLMRRIENEFPTITYNGDPLGLPNLISIGIPKTSKNEMILMKMDMHGVFVSGGSACSSGALHDSHVIKAIGKVNEVRPIRLSMSKYTTQSELDYFLEVLKKV
jgi:cysteine desulfurase